MNCKRQLQDINEKENFLLCLHFKTVKILVVKQFYKSSCFKAYASLVAVLDVGYFISDVGAKSFF